jgi:phage-related protein
MKSWPASLITQLQAEAAHFVWYVELTLTTTWRFCDADFNLKYDGNTYQAESLKVTNIKLTPGLTVDRANIEVGDAAGTLRSVFFSEDVLNKPARLGMVALDSSFQVISAAACFVGFILTYGDITETTVPVILANELMLWRKKALRKSHAGCPWPFKGTECGYSGSGSCNQTYEQCVTLGNQANFGGERWLPAIAEQKLWWGRVPE